MASPLRRHTTAYAKPNRNFSIIILEKYSFIREGSRAMALLLKLVIPISRRIFKSREKLRSEK
jgi:hypothetical protein